MSHLFGWGICPRCEQVVRLFTPRGGDGSSGITQRHDSCHETTLYLQGNLQTAQTFSTDGGQNWKPIHRDQHPYWASKKEAQNALRSLK